ncbi:MAG: hypothetical protein M0R66_00300 [Candidatus Omnitrophica bacterium]|jgi:hypothetical protein|nr:hypothetical protein [Candidatus Omnitrophota bacterium]
MITYRLGGSPQAPARLIAQHDAATRFCRLARVEARARAPLLDPRNTFMRVHVVAPESMSAELPLPLAPEPPIPPPPAPPIPLPPFAGDPPVPQWYGHAYPYPDQPLVVFDAATSFGPDMRAEISLLATPDAGMPPMGPTWFTYFPYTITILAPVPIFASVTVQYS